MSSNTLHNRHPQLRKVAILVANLEDRWAQRVLADLNPSDAALVQAAVQRLGPVDPEEQRDVIEQFRRSTMPSPPPRYDGVELDASLLAKMEQHETDNSPAKSDFSGSPLDALTEIDASTIGDMLAHEHPQTVAVVLSRLDNDMAANVLSNMPSSLQADILARLADLNPADQQTLEVVESQLAKWIEHHRLRQQRMAHGMDLVQRILDCTPKRQQEAILLHLDGRHPTLAKHFSQSVKQSSKQDPSNDSRGSADPSTTSTSRDWKSKFSPKPRTMPNKSGRPRRSPSAPAQPTDRPVSAPLGEVSTNPLAELEHVEDAAILAAIGQSDHQVVSLALAGASDSLMKRILRRLPRRQAKTFRRQLRAIGPTRLSDMLAAQQDFVKSVHQLTKQEEISRK